MDEFYPIFKSSLAHKALSNFHHGWWFSLGRLTLPTGAGESTATCGIPASTGEATRFRHITTTCTRESTCCRIATSTGESALGTHHLSHVASSPLSRRSTAHPHAFAHATATGGTHATATGGTHATATGVTHATATGTTHATATGVTHATATGRAHPSTATAVHATWGSTRRALGRGFFRYGGRCFAFITTTEREQHQGYDSSYESYMTHGRSSPLTGGSRSGNDRKNDPGWRYSGQYHRVNPSIQSNYRMHSGKCRAKNAESLKARQVA